MILEALGDDPEDEIARLDDLCFSICVGCGQDLMFNTLFIDEDSYCIFSCSECKEEADLTTFCGNITFTNPLGCVECGTEINIWDFECGNCHLEYPDDDWYEYIAFILDIGEYGDADAVDCFKLLQNNLSGSSDSFRKQYEEYIDSMLDLCFMCGASDDECICHPQETFWLKDILYLTTHALDAVFYHEIEFNDPRYDDSCFNCSKQYTLLCEKLPEQLITISKSCEPAFKLDTCEYIEYLFGGDSKNSVININGALLDDDHPF